jgi:glucuronate isomerase
VEAGEFPADMALLQKIAADIAYNNVKEYFGEIE